MALTPGSDGAHPPARPPVVELLFFAGCPGYEELVPVLQRVVADAGGTLELRAVEDLETAEAQRFLGSPTVRVNGEDVEPGADERDDYGLKCRLYRTEEGVSGLPQLELVVAALVGTA